ncbi:hypothetical protein L9F63_004313, partial [Diploptera punctata]
RKETIVQRIPLGRVAMGCFPVTQALACHMIAFSLQNIEPRTPARKIWIQHKVLLRSPYSNSFFLGFGSSVMRN